LSGFLIGLAAGVRLSYLLVIPVFLLGVLAIPRLEMRLSRARRLLSISGGVILAGVPIFWYFVREPQKFLYGNFIYPRINTIYRAELGHEVGMTLGGKFLLFAKELWADWHSLVLYAGFLLLLVGIIRSPRFRNSSPWRWLLLISLVVALLVGGFLPTPAWRHYFFAPIPFIVLAIFSGLGKWM